jgi:hypothetical protein
VHRWSGSVWLPVGGALEADYDGHDPIHGDGHEPVRAEREQLVQHRGGHRLAINSGRGHPRITIQSDGRPVVAWEESGFIHVWGLTGSGWQLTARLSVFAENAALYPSLAASGGGWLAVAWNELDTDHNLDRVFVQRWPGDAWPALGGMLNSHEETDAWMPSVAIGDEGLPVVTFSERDDLGPPGEWVALVKRWSGSTWESVGGVLNVDEAGAALYPAVALSASGDPVVAWSESSSIYVKRFTALP